MSRRKCCLKIIFVFGRDFEDYRIIIISLEFYFYLFNEIQFFGHLFILYLLSIILCKTEGIIMSDLPIVNKNSIFAFVLFGRFTKSLLFGIYLLYLLFSLSYLSFIFILADILIFIYSYYLNYRRYFCYLLS